jgi:hypothetical protein
MRYLRRTKDATDSGKLDQIESDVPGSMRGFLVSGYAQDLVRETTLTTEQESKRPGHCSHLCELSHARMVCKSLP